MNRTRLRKILTTLCIDAAKKLLAWASKLDGKRGFKVVSADAPVRDVAQAKYLQEVCSKLETIGALCNEYKRLADYREEQIQTERGEG